MAATNSGLFVYAARFGYAACGFIYVVIGLVAVAVSLGIIEEPAGSHGIMRFLSRQPLAPLLLGALGIGLAGYAALNIAGGIYDPEARGTSPRGVILRTIDILTGALYITLTLLALGFLVGSFSDSSDTATVFAGRILRAPFGRAILAGIGISLVISSGYLFVRAAREPFGHMLDRRAISKKARAAIAVAARAGTAARAIVFAICGFLAIEAGAIGSAEKIGDVDDALSLVGRAAFGPFLLIAMGAGFISYGLYQLSKARYQRVVNSGVTNATDPRRS